MTTEKMEITLLKPSQVSKEMGMSIIYLKPWDCEVRYYVRFPSVKGLYKVEDSDTDGIIAVLQGGQ